MMKKLEYILRLSLVLVISLTFIISPEMAYATERDLETLGDYRKQYEELLAEKRANDNKTEQAKNEIKEKEAAISQTRDELTIAEAAEEEAQLKITESNQAIEENKKESEKVLVYMQQVQNKNAYVEYVTGSSSMTELVTRIEAIKQVSDYIQVTLDNLETEIDKNEKLKKELEEKQKELTAKIGSYQSAVAKLNSDIDDIAELNEGIDKQVEMARDNYEKNKAMCIKEVGSGADNIKVSTCSKIPYNGQWLQPLTKGVITSKVGYRTDPITGKPYSFHSGIDIGASEGTPVYASAAGKVSGIISRSSCGGNKVYIDVTVNGKKYTTYYLHLLKYNVKVGDIVTQNTVIGYVGGYSTSKAHGGYDGCTTGAHLHYGVQNGWYGGYVKTANVLIPPPGMKNSVGWRFNSRTDLYAG